MQVIDILEKIKGEILTKKSTNQTFDDIYAGDLLSHVMAHAKENNLFLTIMANMNAIAVASLLDMKVIVFAEDVKPTLEMISKADDEGIMLITSPYNVVEIIRKVYEI